MTIRSSSASVDRGPADTPDQDRGEKEDDSARASHGIAFGPLLGLLLLVLLWLSVLAHDRRKEGRVLPVTWTAFGLYWLGVLASLVFGQSAWGQSFILGLFS